MILPVAPRRRLFALSAGFAAGTMAAPAVARADDCTEDTLDRIKRTKKFNLGVRDATPPYGWKGADGTYLGFATDIARAIHAAVGKELGTTIELTMTPVTGQTRLPLLQNGTIDMEAGATVITRSRAKIVDFAVPVFLTSTEILVPADSPIKTVKDLAGKRVGVPQGGGGENIFAGLTQNGRVRPAARVIGFPDHPQGFRALQTGSIDAYCTDGPILYSMKVKASDPSQWRVFDLEADVELQAFPIRPESSRFKSVADLTIVEMFASGEWEKIYDKYFGPHGVAPFERTAALDTMARMNAWADH
jgi:ABC-type amino acid transport substrate-binding protein